MQPRRVSVFFYGLFMDADLLRQKGVDPKQISAASVSGLELRIGRRAALAERDGAVVHGVVMSLTHSDVEKLYGEESVRMYKPEAVSVRLPDGESLCAVCFNLAEPPAAEERNDEYAAKLRDLATKLKLPKEYVASIGSS